MIAPHRRDHDAADTGLVGEPFDFGDRTLDAVGDRHEADTGAPLGTRRGQFDEKTVVGACAREREIGIFDHAGRQARAERRRFHAGDRVGVGKDHLGRNTVGVHFLVASFGVPRAAQTFFVGLFPVGDVFVVQLHREFVIGVLLGENFVEGGVILRVEIRAVLLTRQARMRIGADNRVALGRGRHDLFPSTERSSYR